MAKILIVEDDMILALALKRNLQKLDHIVLEVQSNGIGAIDAVQTNHPDLIIMDIKILGSIDGIQTMLEIRKFSEIPVIYVSGNSNESIKERTLETASSEFMSKPVDLTELKERINKAIELTKKKII